MTEVLTITDEMVAHVRTFLGQGGRKFFRRVAAFKGGVSVHISESQAHHLRNRTSLPTTEMFPPGDLPHPIHLREGEAIRNVLRGSGLCEEWTDHDYDDQWSNIVDKAMRNEAFDRGWLAAYQDACENCHFAGIGGTDRRDAPIAPDYVPKEDREDYLLGYIAYARKTWGPDWRTVGLEWVPVMQISADGISVPDKDGGWTDVEEPGNNSDNPEAISDNSDSSCPHCGDPWCIGATHDPNECPEAHRDESESESEPDAEALSEAIRYHREKADELEGIDTDRALFHLARARWLTELQELRKGR